MLILLLLSCLLSLSLFHPSLSLSFRDLISIPSFNVILILYWPLCPLCVLFLSNWSHVIPFSTWNGYFSLFSMDLYLSLFHSIPFHPWIPCVSLCLYLFVNVMCVSLGIGFFLRFFFSFLLFFHESLTRAGIGDLFDMLLPMLVIYQEYVRNHHFSLQVLAECKQKDVFVKMLRRLEEKAVLQGRTLETFLTYPMHQVCIK